MGDEFPHPLFDSFPQYGLVVLTALCRRINNKPLTFASVVYRKPFGFLRFLFFGYRSFIYHHLLSCLSFG